MAKYSKEGQDQFALLCNPQRGPKFYLDLGSAHPEDGNNTVRLEEQGWDGLRFDINPHVKHIPTKRTSHQIIGDISQPGVLADCLKRFGCPKLINYISFDVDEGTVGAALAFPWVERRFTCMTFEHDKRNRDLCEAQFIIRDVSMKFGYSIITDVCYEDNGLHIFEDWLIDRETIPMELLPKLDRMEAGLPWHEVIKRLQ